jgi:signal transduction histidine kinase
MRPILDQQGNKIKRGFSPFYLAIFSGVLLTILIINGVLEIQRTKNGFYLLLEREAIVLIQHYEKNIRETLSMLQLMENGPPPPMLGTLYGLEESIAEYLVDVAYRIDQMDREKPLTSKDLQSMVAPYLISSIEICDPRGNLIRGWPPPSSPINRSPLLQELIDKRRSVLIDLFEKPLAGEGQWFSVAIWRRGIPGIIVLRLDSGQMRKIVRQFAIQRAISDMGLREGVLYISVQDAQLQTLAHTSSGLPDTGEDKPFLKRVLQSDKPLSHLLRPSKEEEVFEVAKSFSLKNNLMGLIRIGYSPKEIEPILQQNKKTVALSVLFFLMLGISANVLIWIDQNRHLRKLKEMEDRIRLAERLSSLGHLAAGVAHEIRNPLNAIGMGIQRLKREFPPPEESKRSEFLSFAELILKETRRVNQIIEQFLTLSRPFQLRLKESSPGELLNGLVTLFQEEASTLGIKIETDIDSSLPSIQMDDEKLTQAFINIMKNGMQAMERGGVLRIEAHGIRDRVEVKISDSGTGIPPEQMEKIFNYYYTTKEKGVGLGLPIAHRIIEAHQGQLRVESQVGIGTAVTITLPIKKGRPQAEAER